MGALKQQGVAKKNPENSHLHYWRELRNEMLVLVQEARPRDDISSQPKILYFCDQLALRICKLKQSLEDGAFEDRSSRIILEALDALVDLPMDVVTFHPHVRTGHDCAGDLDTRELLRVVRTREKPT